MLEWLQHPPPLLLQNNPHTFIMNEYYTGAIVQIFSCFKKARILSNIIVFEIYAYIEYITLMNVVAKFNNDFASLMGGKEREGGNYLSLSWIHETIESPPSLPALETVLVSDEGGGKNKQERKR